MSAIQQTWYGSPSLWIQPNGHPTSSPLLASSVSWADFELRKANRSVRISWCSLRCLLIRPIRFVWYRVHVPYGISVNNSRIIENDKIVGLVNKPYSNTFLSIRLKVNFKIYIREKNGNVHVIYYIYGTFITFGTLHAVNVIFEAIKECVLLDK